MNINILGTKVHVVLVFVGALCVLLLFGCIGVISWGSRKMNQQDEATNKHSEETADLKNLTEHLKTENVKLQKETEKLSRQIENLDDKSHKETEKLNQTIQLIQKFKAFLFNELCNGPECLLCQTGWIFFSESCYFISNDYLTWNESRFFCQLKSADLIVINNQQEQEFIYYKLNTNKYYWLGLRKVGSNWVWVDGRIDTLGFWSSSYQYSPYSNAYAFMYRTGSPTASWGSGSNTYSRRPLCEQKALKLSLN
ncbi:C-type lectin domain family 10 member A-like [Xiphophorus maculatus]|uniref:C-type lectin domain family 10 member A-like n=1 Tax=Xiphophorus maculatus TaxID=8083 RepID=M4AG20_XIPMA|nr:C-type lectin domain family 10 member A-like [Xiphophorus maculatus]